MARKRNPNRIPPGPCRFNRKDLILRFWQVIPSTIPALNRLIRRIVRVARALECAGGELHKVELALREALVNAVVHGSGRDRKKKVSVCCLCDEAKGMLLVVRDHGPGFDPSRVPDPRKAKRVFSAHGRGIFLMRQLMDEVRFRKGGREVLMKKAARPHPTRRRTA